MHSIFFLLSLHSSKNKIRYYFLAWGWRMGTFCLYPVVHFIILHSWGWRVGTFYLYLVIYFNDLPVWGWGIGTFCLYPNIHSEVICSCVWRIGTFHLYPDPLQCLVQLGLEDRYTLLVPRSTPMSSAAGGWRIYISFVCTYLFTSMSHPAVFGGSVPSACTQIHSNVLCSGGWRIGTFCLYLHIQCSLSHTAMVGGSVHSACTQIHSIVLCSRGWVIGTFCLYLPVHCSSLFNVTYCCGWRIGTFYLYPDLLQGLTPTWFHSLGLGPLLGYVAFRTLLKWGEI